MIKVNRIVLFIAALLISGAAITETFAESFTVGDLTYTVKSTSEVSVKLNSEITPSTVKSVNIPSQVTNSGTTYAVTEIKSSAFSGCIALKAVTLPPTITLISSYAFKQCTKLTSITLPASVNEINSYAFQSDSELRTILYEGTEAPKLTQSLSSVRPDIILQVLSSTAKDDFENYSTWKNNWLNSINEIVIVPVAISESADNSSELTAKAGLTADVNLTRTIHHESYNSICLPFALSTAQVEAVFGAGCDIEELTDASIANEEITLKFTKRTAMEAGKPYLIKPASTVTNPTVCNAVLTNTVVPSGNADVTFSGIFSPTQMETSDNTLVIGAENKLHPVTAGEMPGLRGFFVLKTDRARAAAKRGIHLSMGGNNEETAIETAQVAETPTTKCIINGQLHIIRNGIHYDAQGSIIQ